MPKGRGRRTQQLITVSVLGSATLACGSGSWSVESEPVDSSVSLLEGASESETLLRADTSHRGRVHVLVNLPGVTDTEQKLVVAELILDEAHSLLTLPGSGGRLSALCPGERCRRDEARLTLRLLAEAELPDTGVFVEWTAHAETFGDGSATPDAARAEISVAR